MFARNIQHWELKDTWIAEWAGNPGRQQQSEFLASSRFKLSLIPTSLLTSLNHQSFSQLCKCRTGHEHIGLYYQQFVPTEEQACKCRHYLRTQEHISPKARFDTFLQMLCQRKVYLHTLLPNIQSILQAGVKYGLNFDSLSLPIAHNVESRPWWPSCLARHRQNIAMWEPWVQFTLVASFQTFVNSPFHFALLHFISASFTLLTYCLHGNFISAHFAFISNSLLSISVYYKFSCFANCTT